MRKRESSWEVFIDESRSSSAYLTYEVVDHKVFLTCLSLYDSFYGTSRAICTIPKLQLNPHGKVLESNSFCFCRGFIDLELWPSREGAKRERDA